MIEALGDIVLMLAIVAGGILMIVVNVNYVPDKENEDEDR
tara:strand:+ start:36 stop:155 length:120 start_codon:yes stop_codon:yes gene_type:complete